MSRFTAGRLNYEYTATVTKVVDGDTVHLDIDQGLDNNRKINCRLYGLNAPELRTVAGPPARDHLAKLLGWSETVKPQVYIRTIKDRTEKYGRYLVTIFLTTAMSESVNDRMIRDGHAVAYYP